MVEKRPLVLFLLFSFILLIMVSLLTLLAVLPLSLGYERPNGVGRLPALGWNSWNKFKCDIDESKFLTAAEKFVSLGLKDVGYEYVNIDDCWQVKEGRGTDNRLIPDPAKFPHGIKATADKIHEMGLKIGIYSSAGSRTCAKYPASLGFEELDAKTWAEWGIDYLKYDNCPYNGSGDITPVDAELLDECNWCVPENRPLSNGTCTETDGLNFCPAGYDFSQSNTAFRFRLMRDALEKQDRVILYSLCQWGTADVQSWGNATGASWRSTNDIFPEWTRITDIWNQQSFLMNNVDFWGHSDADMLELGNGNLNFEQGRTHFAVWAIMKSPLLIGADLETLSKENVDVLKNKYLLAFNQDPIVGRPAAPYKWGTNPDWTFDWLRPAEYWSGSYGNGDTIVLIHNPESTGQKVVYADWAEIPQLKKNHAYYVKDAWTGENWGCLKHGVGMRVNAYDSAVLVIGRECEPSSEKDELKVKRWTA